MIVFDHVSKTYPNGYQALKDINLTIEQGEFVAIIGLSGAGKSTLIRTINRMHDITDGTLTVDGVNVMELKGARLRQFRRNIGMIFQSFNLVTRTTVIKNVLTSRVPELPFWRALLGAYPKKDKLEALEALDKVGILDKAFVRADQLSGGQQQRVALARTLAQNPKIILADEPVASLDPVTAKPGNGRFPAHQPGDEYLGAHQYPPCGSGAAVCRPCHRHQAGEVVYDGPASEVNEAVLAEVYGGQFEAGV